MNQIAGEAGIGGVLVVEDDPGLSKQLKWALEGYATEFAGNRADAIDRVAGIHGPCGGNRGRSAGPGRRG